MLFVSSNTLRPHKKLTLQPSLNKQRVIWQKLPIDIDPIAKPVAVHLHPYPIPHIYLSMFKHELDHIVKLGDMVPQKGNWVGKSLLHHSSERWQCPLDQQPDSVKQSD